MLRESDCFLSLKFCVDLSPYSGVSSLSLEEVMPDGESMSSGLNGGSAPLTV